MSVKTALRRSMDRLTVPLALLALVALLPSATADWPMEGYDGGRTSAAPGEFPERYEVAWVFNGSERVSGLVASAEIIYFIDANPSTNQNTLRAISVGNGEEVWNYTQSTNQTLPTYAYFAVAPTVAEEYIIVNEVVLTLVNETVREDIYLRAFDATTGSERWNRTLNSSLNGAPVVEGDRLYAVDWVNSIYVYNFTTGEVLAQAETDTEWILAWAAVGGVFYFFAEYPEGDYVTAFDPASNATLWTRSLSEGHEVIMVVDGKVFCSKNGNKQSIIRVLDAVTGDLMTTLYSGENVVDMAWSEDTLLLKHSGGLSAVPLDGSPATSWDYSVGSYTSLAVGDGKVVVQGLNESVKSLLRVLSLYTGEVLDTFAVDEKTFRRAPIFSDGRIYFTTDGHLYALRKLRQPDLTVAGLALTPSDSLREGDSVTLNFTLLNLGDRGAVNAFATIYDNGVLWRNESLSNVTMGWQQNYTVVWDTTGRPGWHDLTVAVEEVEPDDYNLSDNRAMLRVYVRPLRVDGALLGAEYAPAEPKAGDAVRFNVAVANAGETVLEGLTLTLYDNGTHAASVPVPRLALGESRNLTLEWRADTPGDHALALVLEGVMPADTSPVNNSLDLSLPVRPLRLDLALAGLSLEPARPRVGEGVKLSATVTNRGEGWVTAAVRFYLGNTTGELLDEISVTLEPGETARPALPWHPPRAGKLTLTVEVADDYGDYQPENNRLTLVVPVQGDAEALEGRSWVYVGAALTVTGAAAAGLWHWRWRG